MHFVKMHIRIDFFTISNVLQIETGNASTWQLGRTVALQLLVGLSPDP